MVKAQLTNLGELPENSKLHTAMINMAAHDKRRGHLGNASRPIFVRNSNQTIGIPKPKQKKESPKLSETNLGYGFFQTLTLSGKMLYGEFSTSTVLRPSKPSEDFEPQLFGNQLQDQNLRKLETRLDEVMPTPDYESKTPNFFAKNIESLGYAIGLAEEVFNMEPGQAVAYVDQIVRPIHRELVGKAKNAGVSKPDLGDVTLAIVRDSYIQFGDPTEDDITYVNELADHLQLSYEELSFILRDGEVEPELGNASFIDPLVYRAEEDTFLVQNMPLDNPEGRLPGIRENRTEEEQKQPTTQPMR